MSLNGLSVEKEDLEKLKIIESIFKEIYILGHDNYFELGENLGYFREKYGSQIINEIMCADEIRYIINSSSN